ncbi:MAG: hypothetical protein AB8B60_06215 [Sulfitobacter sp.]
MFPIWISLCIALLLVTAVIHSVGGEVYLLRPLFRKRGNKVLENPLARMILRFAWHVTSLSWAVLAVILYAVAFRPGDVIAVTLGTVGLVFGLVGLFDLVASKGKHVGWPFLVLIGICALLALGASNAWH